MNNYDLARMLTGTLSGWQQDLDAYRNKTGPYWVPDPASYMTLAVMQSNQFKAKSLRESIQRLMDSVPQDPWNFAPMNELISLLQIKEFAYTQQINESYPAAPPPVELPKTPDEETPVVPEETGGVIEWVKANPIPVILGSLFVVNLLLPKNKKLIKI